MGHLRTLKTRKTRHFPVLHSLSVTAFVTSGDHSEGVPPVPIPNTEVKPFSADGTAFWWESRSLPDVFFILLTDEW